MKMKPILTVLALMGSLTSIFADLTIPSDGSDGVFPPVGAPTTGTYEVDLSQAVTGTWSAPSSLPGKGIYDVQKWAVVFKYLSVNIPAGLTITFKNHGSYAPVVWLVQGSVNITGTVSVNGKVGVTGPAAAIPTEPGPGGFRGGAYGPAGTGYGLGPGGGPPDVSVGNIGTFYNTVYGSPSILPLIGGSGSARAFNRAFSGGGGGGAILIAAPSTITVTGAISALGGSDSNTAAGSGGAIKLIADQVSGNGSLNAATTGRVRIEANTLSANVVTTPPTIKVEPGATPTIFQSNTSPTVKITKIAAVGIPNANDPRANLVTDADMLISINTPVVIELETQNFSTTGVVSVRIAQKFGAATTANATYVSGTSAPALWRTGNVTIAPGFTTLQARATVP